MKILSPAGNFESLKMAVYNGADEVYLGINDFNARNNIDGFSMDTLENAVAFAHLHGVKVHLAINILFTDEEMKSAIDIVGKAISFGVDAFIVQDLGLISLINKLYPEAEIHLSTQMGLHNLEGIKALSKYKFKRVVLARETPLSEIRRIKDNADVEIEYFAQGALCVSFSGNCYLSSYTLNASGNRGKCKQLCRLPYTLKKDGKNLKTGYLLSAKDFNMLSRLDDLKKAGVDAIKIEGRARRPYYVGVATRQYYNALNGKKTDEAQLKLAFNRTYTEGYFNGNGNIISKLQNHIGVEIGKVEKVNFGKKFNEIYFTSNRELFPKSTLKFFFSNKEITISAFDLKKVGGNKYFLTTTSVVEVGAKVNLIVDSADEKKVLEYVKKVPVDIQVFAKIHQPIKAITNINGKAVEVFGEVLDSAKSSPLSIMELQKNFEKSEFFAPNLEIKELDNVFILKQKLNDFRRNFYDKLYAELTKVEKKYQAKNLPNLPKISPFKDFEIVENLDIKFNAKNLIYSPEEYVLEDVLAFKNECEKLGKKAYLDTPNFALEQDIKILKEIIDKTQIGVVANNYYATILTDNFIVGAGLNVYNHYTAFEWEKPFITAETELGERVDFAHMTLIHCPMRNHLKSTCDNCKFENGYVYKMDSGKELKLKRKKICSCVFYLTD
ncbi:MAG: U32 family peptidase [Clostridia bacterium]|nr:U32 family peptidase [Clostridia bacterium]